MFTEDPVRTTGDEIEKYTEEQSDYYKARTIRTTYIIVSCYIISMFFWDWFGDRILKVVIRDDETITLFKNWIFTGVTCLFLLHIIIYYLKYIKLLRKAIDYKVCKRAFDEKEIVLIKEMFDSIIDEKIYYQKKSSKYRYQLGNLEKVYQTILENTNEVIWEDRNGELNFSERWYEILGYYRGEKENYQQWEELIHPSDRSAVARLIDKFEPNYPLEFYKEFRIRAKSGQYRWMRTKGKCLVNGDGDIYHMIGICTDITELKEYENRMHNFLRCDQLSGLQNRFALNETLVNYMGSNASNKFALLFIDIDNFKNVNDLMGPSYGDNLLRNVSDRLKKLVADETRLFRIGADEFVILINEFEKKEEIEKKAVDIMGAFNKQFDIMESSLTITVSIGISLYPEHGINIDTLLRDANIAVDKAKENGKNRIVFYNEPLNEIIAERLLIEKNLRNALMKEEFELYYQPQFDLNTNTITGFEALIRWENKELGIVPPNKFIPIAEETNHIVTIGDWVLRTSFEFIKRLHQLGYEDLSISINISMIQMLQDNFTEVVLDTIDQLEVNPRKVELEITESILMESYNAIADKLKLLRTKGIKIALDDFGKGYSSLNHLLQLPITTLKIDKTFIDKIASSGKKKSVTDLIVNLGKSLDLNVVAEGVETEEQMKYLELLECHKIQGYYFCKPLPEGSVFNSINKEWHSRNYIKKTKEELYVN